MSVSFWGEQVLSEAFISSQIKQSNEIYIINKKSDVGSIASVLQKAQELDPDLEYHATGPENEALADLENSSFLVSDTYFRVKGNSNVHTFLAEQKSFCPLKDHPHFSKEKFHETKAPPLDRLRNNPNPDIMNYNIIIDTKKVSVGTESSLRESVAMTGENTFDIDYSRQKNIDYPECKTLVSVPVTSTGLELLRFLNHDGLNCVWGYQADDDSEPIPKQLAHPVLYASLYVANSLNSDRAA